MQLQYIIQTSYTALSCVYQWYHACVHNTVNNTVTVDNTVHNTANVYNTVQNTVTVYNTGTLYLYLVLCLSVVSLLYT